MGRLSKGEIGFNGLLTSLERLILAWQPSPMKTELAYSNALADTLRSALPEDTRVEREYRHQGTTCDLCVLYNGILANDQVVIEVKRNLQKKADYDRLVGQVEGLKPSKNKVVIVFVGQTDLALLGRLREQFKGHLENYMSSSFKLLIVS